MDKPIKFAQGRQMQIQKWNSEVYQEWGNKETTTAADGTRHYGIIGTPECP